MKRWVTIWLWILVASPAVAWQAAHSINPESGQIGDKFDYQLTITSDAPLSAEDFTFTPQLGDLETVNEWVLAQANDDETQLQWRVSVTHFNLEGATLPPQTIGDGKVTASLPEIDIPYADAGSSAEPFQNIGFLSIPHHRRRRVGLNEVAADAETRLWRQMTAAADRPT